MGESAKFRQKFPHKVTCDFSFVKMTDTLTPPEGQTNFSGIPEAQFVEDVDSFMKGEENAEDKLKALDERHQKYKMMEGNLMARKRRLKSQLPDITSSLTLINKLRAKKDANEETNSQFLLLIRYIYGLVPMLCWSTAWTTPKSY